MRIQFKQRNKVRTISVKAYGLNQVKALLASLNCEIMWIKGGL
jgi:hypothetical protein